MTVLQHRKPKHKLAVVEPLQRRQFRTMNERLKSIVNLQVKGTGWRLALREVKVLRGASESCRYGAQTPRGLACRYSV